MPCRGFCSCPAEVSFLHCQGSVSTLRRHPVQVLPVQGSSSTLCRVPFPGFFSTRRRIPFFRPVPDSFSTLCPVQGSFSTLCRVPCPPCAGTLCIFCPGVSFLPCRGILSILRKVLVELQESLLDPTRVSFLPCVFPFHPQGVFFSALQVFFALLGFLFCPAKVSFLPCGVCFLPCRGFFPALQGFSPALQGFLSCPAGFLSFPAEVSCPPSRGLPFAP